MADLRPDGRPVTLAGITLVTPGLAGRVDVHSGGSGASRAAIADTDAFLRAMENTDMTEQASVEIQGHQEVDGGSGGSRAAGGGADIILTAPGPGQGFGQVLLYAAEDGSLSWHFPTDVPRPEIAARAPSQLTYRVPRAIVTAEVEPGDRGLVGVIGKKVLKLLFFPLLDAAAGAAANYFVERYETQHRPHCFRTFDPASYGTDGRNLEPADWQALATGRALLFVHGTASHARSAFGRIPHGLMAQLSARHGDRVFAFDHPTVSPDPRVNARWFAENLPVPMDVDIVAHSRGGLVSRLLTERVNDFQLTGQLRVGTLLMVAAPNAGTALADTTNLDDLANRFTNLVQFLPDNGATDALDLVLSVVKQLAIGALGGLDGLMSMNPHSPFLTTYLNVSTAVSVTYRAVGADYKPPGGSPLLRVARDAATDLVFRNAPNDLVVPTSGANEVPGAAMFPIAEPLLFPRADGVDHSTYWDRAPFVAAAQNWLTG
jgi:hypothetical protein